MKHEIAKKTLIYRTLAFTCGLIVGIFATIFLNIPFYINLIIAVVSEVVSIGLYYSFENYWRRLIERIKIKKGMNLFSIEVNGKVKIGYNVLEVLEDNKFIIEVV